MSKKLDVFFKRLVTDYRFREKFMSAKTAKEGYELALPYLGSEVSFKEFKKCLTNVYANVRANGKKPLSKEEYSKVSGGAVCWDQIINVIKNVI